MFILLCLAGLALAIGVAGPGDCKDESSSMLQVRVKSHYALHVGSMVERVQTTTVSKIGSTHLDLNDTGMNFDVLEEFDEESGLCKHRKNINGSVELTPAIGMIKRHDRMVLPRVGGNSEGSQCVVSHTYKFVFVHVLKNAGSLSKEWLQDALCQNGCTEDDFSMKDCIGAMSGYPDYLRWSWARNPFDRALSVYGMALHYDLPESVSFEDFWLDEDRWGKTYLSLDHGRPQSEFMTDGRNCLALDFVGWLPDSAEYMEQLLSLLQAPPLTNHFRTVGFERPSSGNVFGLQQEQEGGSGEMRVKQNETVQQALEELYSQDFDVFLSQSQ